MAATPIPARSGATTCTTRPWSARSTPPSPNSATAPTTPSTTLSGSASAPPAPAPASSAFMPWATTSPSSPEAIASYEVFSLSGALIARGEVNATSFDLDLGRLPTGTYLLRTRSEGMTQTRRFVKR